MPGVRLDGGAHVFGDLFTCGSLTEKLDVFFPGKRHENADTGGSATVEKPARRRMIDSHNVHARLAHQRQIGIHLFRPANVIAIPIRFEGTVRDTFNEKLPVSVEEELRSGSDSRVCCLCHVERVDTSLDVFFALDGKTRSAFAQSYDGASDFAVRCPTPTQLAAQFFKATAFVFGRGQSSARRLDCTSSGAQIGLAVPCQPFVGPRVGAHRSARPTMARPTGL